MKGTIELENPVIIDGKETKKLDYDTEAVSGDLFIKASSMAFQEARGTGSMTGLTIVNDYSTHLMLGFAAVEAVNPDADMLTLKRHVKGADLMAFLGVGVNFILPLVAPGKSSSEEQSENTVESSTPQ